MLSLTRDMNAAQRFFRSTLLVNEGPNKSQPTDTIPTLAPSAKCLGSNVQHRCSAYLNRRIEQDHRGVKQRYYPRLGFGAFLSAKRFCQAFEQVRQYFRPRRRRKQVVSLAKGRRQFLFRALALESMFLAA